METPLQHTKGKILIVFLSEAYLLSDMLLILFMRSSLLLFCNEGMTEMCHVMYRPYTMEYPPFYFFGEKVGCNTTAFLYSDWLFLCHGIIKQ